MNAPGSPRFRFRTPEGTEVPVASVEELSSRLERGELGTETPLFDAGTGNWNRAGDVPVFQFVREELRAEGRLPDDDDVDMMVLPEPPPEEPIDPGVEFEPIDHGDGPGRGTDTGSFRPLASPTVDPFELHLPLSNPLDPLEDARGQAPPEASPEGPTAPEGSARQGDPAVEPDREPDPVPDREPDPELDREPWFEDREEPDDRAEGEAETETEAEAGHRSPEPGLEIDPSPLHAWLTHGPPTPVVPTPPPRPERRGAGADHGPDHGPDRGSEGGPGVAAPGTGDLADGVREGAPSEASTPSPPASGPSTTGESALPATPVAIRTAWEDHEAGEDPRALRLRSRRRQRNARLMAGLAALVIVGVGGVAIYSTVQAPGAGPAAGANAEPASPGGDGGTVEQMGLPPRLQGRAAAAWAAIPAEVSLLVDSLRAEAELEDAPPRAWLGGYYLANAGEFPGVVEFWERYGAFVGSLASQDAGLFRQAGARVLERLESEASAADTSAAAAALGAADRARILDALEARHARAEGARQDRYLHLQRTAEAALDLHAFLVSNGESISYSPALGQGVSVDPVLEAVTDTPEIRRQMEQNLDRIFAALDRTRGGGQPSLAGLRTELFGSLGRPF